MKQYGILAYPAKHSLSPVMHNAAFKELQIDAQYGTFEIPETELADFIERVKHEPIDGLSVSVPYKERILEFLNFRDEATSKIGACNTVINDGGILKGYNTDFIGAVKALKSMLSDLAGKRAVVIGAGGSARAIIYGLMNEGVDVFVVNRTREKADKLAIEFAEMFDAQIHSGDFGELVEGDILIQTTSIWFKEDINELPYFCDQDYVNGFEAVMDIVYAPMMTPLLQVANNLEKQIITGDKMLLFQAIEQFRLFTGKEAPIDIMKRALDKVLI